MVDILIAEDVGLIRETLCNVFSEAGYSVLTACNGTDALDILRRHSDIKVLLTDVNMPEMDGIDLVTAVRNDLNNREIKVLFMTIEPNNALREKSRQLDILGWIVKPIDNAAILKMLRRLLPKQTPDQAADNELNANDGALPRQDGSTFGTSPHA